MTQIELAPPTPAVAADDVTTTTTATVTATAQQTLVPPTAAPPPNAKEPVTATLLLNDGTAFQGYSFGAEKQSVAGECVFQTGMVGYPESVTDPSYRGQILVLTFPLVGNYGVPSRTVVDAHLNNLQKYFESTEIHVAALIVAHYSYDYSHYLAQSSLSEWLKENNVPALYAIDTRALTKKIRTKGALLGKVLFPKSLVGEGEKPDAEEAARFPWIKDFSDLAWHDPNTRNLVAEVSRKQPVVYTPPSDQANIVRKKNGKILRVLAVDVGLKNNQIRCFIKRGVEVKVVPWDYDFISGDRDFDGIFISNGPGDPVTLKPTIERLAQQMKLADKPMFGICLGHQLIALASGATTKKMKYGNRGHNIPCTNKQTGRCYITSQNHGYCVDVATLTPGWVEYFVNANDGSNEGITHETLPYFSVQFHPESTPGPWDTEYLFDRFIKSAEDCANAGKLLPLPAEPKPPAAIRQRPRKVLILGSGGLSIGQAGEFDYSGSQAIKALKEEGIYTILINPNIATIQTSQGLADKVYFLPVTPDFVRKVIKHEKPDGIYCTFGGQTALNVGVKLKDEFEELGVTVLGTPISTIEVTEDRDLFAQTMAEIGEKCAKSESANTIEEAMAAGTRIGFPLIIRAAYALGGLGSGFADNEQELLALCTKAFATSPQVLVERSMKGWKEIEYEVVRDASDNCITVCNMENFDPLGIHTGDSIVVAPSQTLSDEDYMMLRRTAVNVIRHLGVIGECNIQYALNPVSKEYCIIEVNARLSRSSALASKATGYPLAFVAAKLGLGIPLTEVKNSVTKKTIACFEPSLDYVVVKIPRWDLKKFNRVSTKVGSAMKSVGEVMAIGRNFEETIQKAIRSVDYALAGFAENDIVHADLDEELRHPSDQRLFAVAKALHSGYSVDQIWKLTNIDKWFLNKLKGIVDLDKHMATLTPSTVTPSLIKFAKQTGFSDRQIADAIGTTELGVRKIRTDWGITPFVKQIDTVAAEFPCYTNYLYMTYNAAEHDVSFEDKGVMVLGSGVYRIGSSVEFDWCAVRCIRTLREYGIKTIMVNYNPETVSTDYDEADRLYFETLTLERVLDIYQIETANGVVVSMGGQSPNNIALPLHRMNVNILGTSPEMIDSAENRYKFSRLLDKIGVDQPLWKELTSIDEATQFCEKVGFPVLVRPSYVLSGAAMNVVYSLNDLRSYLDLAVQVSRDYPVVISKFIEEAKEIEMDAVAHNGKLIMHVISEHVENAGVHSGDATLVLPPQDLDPETVRKIVDATRKIGQALNVTGPYNIQFIAKNNEIKVIECNVRASRSFPFCSKVLGVDLIELATKAMTGQTYEAYPPVETRSDYVAIKVPQFSFSRLAGADPILGVEMASTGEVACFGRDKYEAYMKALLATGFTVPKKNVLISIGSFKEKLEFLPSVQKLHQLGYNLFATTGTADFIQEHGIPVQYLEALDDSTAHLPQQKLEYSLTQHLANNLIDLYINLPSKNRFRRPASYMSRGYRSRRMAVDFAVPLITNVKCAKLFIEALGRWSGIDEFQVSEIDYQTSFRTVRLPGLINVRSLLDVEGAGDLSSITKDAVSGGFTMVCGVGEQSSVKKGTRAHCDYAVSTIATSANVNKIQLGTNTSMSLYIGLGKGRLEKLTDLAAHLHNWPRDSPIVACAKETDLASVLFLANLHSRPIHITNLRTAADIALIVLSKEKGVEVTCDVCVETLFLDPKETGVEQADVNALWENLEHVDVFSVLGRETTNALPRLLSAVADGRLTVDDITAKLYENPSRIFGVPSQKDTYVEVEIQRKLEVGTGGFVSRVVLRGETVYLDGTTIEGPAGKDITGSVRIAAAPIVQRDSRKMSVMMDLLPRKETAALPVPKSPSRVRSSDGESKRSSTEGLDSDAALDKTPNRDLFDAGKGKKSVGADLNPSSQYISDYLSSSASAAVAKSPFFRKHILSVKQFTRHDLHMLFGVAQEMRTLVERFGTVNLLAGKVMCSAFWEPSTRTSCSFTAAFQRLGGSVVSMNEENSSVKKGESLGDTVRTLSCYGDVIVMRHPAPGSAQLASTYATVPILNAGDGVGEHPTQAFLDTFTIREELGTVNGLTVTMVGDLKNGRTVHSLVRLLALYDVKLNFVSPPTLRMPEEIKAEASKANLVYNEYNSIEEVIATTDVLYVTRIQKERFDSVAEYDAVANAYVITNKTLQSAKRNMIVMHPLPRVAEIHPEVDFDQRAAYFRQMRYGLFVRMALLALVCGRSNN
ncbi:uncharacterized protein EV422DRAFT_616705 [Fimicolochytrium jonesii]|uniref:uncharacterized protein n=1 Tax=Fimicolochytrium jonesii TaxID=1396493 RepID=UPI0022FE10E2|nr:uncharacterized protein EV422DRAFT_616705 [Fimicolochytrium jonesii]KAI8825622.1 hypothetical protein EV422DRAFT_616705 [Fimicolochytrium jonesii]